jgi:hypothetical protein
MKLDLRNSVNVLGLLFVSLFVSHTSMAQAPSINPNYIRFCSGQWSDGDCRFDQATVPDFNSVSELRNFVQNLSVRLGKVEEENASLKKRLATLESYPSNQCTIEVVGTCTNIPGWSNRSFADASGMLLKNSGLDQAQCQSRAKAYFDRCGGGVTVFSTFTNSRKRFKFPNN